MARLTTLKIQDMKDQGDPIAMVTAYDATFAALIDQAGADLLLVGDSLGMVIQGHDNTLTVTMDQMVYHTQMVARGSERALVVADMPFMSYQASVSDAMRNAGRLIAEGGAQAVKLEGGERVAEAIASIVASGIPVMGHLGLTPQSVHALGGFKVQGRGDEAAELLVADALLLQEAGAFAIVLETVPGHVAKRVTEAVSVPTIGIGAGVDCGGQVLVCYDLLGLTNGFTPRFLKRYDELGGSVKDAATSFVNDVKTRAFPGPEHTFE
jgi:3-methyl-2-oxobutanoate hydroxymethyltransferase